MILGETRSRSAQTDAQTTLDDIFRRAAARRPDAIALCDPPNRSDFTDGAPRRLTYRQADRIIDAIAARLRKLGLQPDAVVGVALPNTVESVLTVLAVMRSGMIAAPLPLLWRHAEASAALDRIGAKAIVTTARIGGLEPSDVAMKVASALFQIRYVCGFGANLPDGVVPFDDLLADDAAGEPPPPHERDAEAALNVALVTFDVTPDGMVAVARNHAELIAGGLAVMLEGGLQQDAVILGGTALGSFSGLALQVVPWLLSGGTLCLHQAFDAMTFAAQARSERCDTMIVPAALVPRLAAAELLAHPELRNVLAVWRTPERISSAAVWQHPAARVIDVLVFGEAALLAARRGADGLPVPLPPGDISAPRGSAQALWIAEIARTAAGTLALRGPMVPRHAFPPGAERLDAPYWRTNAAGFVDTFYACRHDRAAATVELTGPPPGLISVGGYRFVLRELEELVHRASAGAAIAALPDALAGHRLAGLASDAHGTRTDLLTRGANALVAQAFSDRGSSQAA